jgi:putative endonuclease
MAGHVYIMASQTRGTLYIGVTSDLSRRVYEHKEGLTPSFTGRYGCKRLVWYEEHYDIRDAIAREKALKKWPRARKIALIEALNPDWSELYKGMGGECSHLAVVILGAVAPGIHAQTWRSLLRLRKDRQAGAYSDPSRHGSPRFARG